MDLPLPKAVPAAVQNFGRVLADSELCLLHQTADLQTRINFLVVHPALGSDVVASLWRHEKTVKEIRQYLLAKPAGECHGCLKKMTIKEMKARLKAVEAAAQFPDK